MAGTEKRSMLSGKIDSEGHLHTKVRHRDDTVDEQVVEGDPFEEALAINERAMSGVNDRKPSPEPDTWVHPKTGALERELTELTVEDHAQRSLKFEALLVKVLGKSLQEPQSKIVVKDPAFKAMLIEMCQIAGGDYARMVDRIGLQVSLCEGHEG